jgi:hypothetical protein
VKISSPVGIEESVLFNQVSIFPNPNTGLVNIDLGNLEDVMVRVYTIRGRLIYHKENLSDVIHQLVLDESPGVYIVEISSEGVKQQYKLVKQ